MTLAILLSCASAASSGPAQNPPSAVQPGVSRIVLATASDAANQPMGNLSEDDFVIREGGEPREVLSARLADYPIVLLVDNTSASPDDWEAVRKAAARFIAKIGQDRAVALGALARPAALLTPFDDRAGVVKALNSLAPAPLPAPPIVPAITAAAGSIAGTRAPFSAIVIVTASDPGAPIASVEGAVAALVDAHVTIHAIGKAAAAAGAVGTLGDALRVLSDRTRGQYAAIFSAASYASALDRLADRLSSEMMIEFIEPPGAVPSDDVKVGVRVPGARVTGLGVSR